MKMLKAKNKTNNAVNHRSPGRTSNAARASALRAATVIWESVGGGTWLDSEVELGSDNEYESSDGRRVVFLSTPALRYGNFFPDTLTDEEMIAFIAACETRDDVKCEGIELAIAVTAEEEAANEAADKAMKEHLRATGYRVLAADGVEMAIIARNAVADFDGLFAEYRSRGWKILAPDGSEIATDACDRKRSDKAA